MTIDWRGRNEEEKFKTKSTAKRKWTKTAEKNFKFLKRFYLFTFIGEGREKERVASHTPPTGDLACNPHMCPDWESNQQHLASQVGAQTTEPHQPGHILNFWYKWMKNNCLKNWLWCKFLLKCHNIYMFFLPLDILGDREKPHHISKCILDLTICDMSIAHFVHHPVHHQ